MDRDRARLVYTTTPIHVKAEYSNQSRRIDLRGHNRLQAEGRTNLSDAQSDTDVGVGSLQGWKRRLREKSGSLKSELFGCVYHSFFFP